MVADRRKLCRNPPDILITTPESLYLMLTSRARETLASVEHVIIDEIHAMAGTKRGGASLPLASQFVAVGASASSTPIALYHSSTAASARCRATSSDISTG